MPRILWRAVHLVFWSMIVPHARLSSLKINPFNHDILLQSWIAASIFAKEVRLAISALAHLVKRMSRRVISSALNAEQVKKCSTDTIVRNVCEDSLKQKQKRQIAAKSAHKFRDWKHLLEKQRIWVKTLSLLASRRRVRWWSRLEMCLHWIELEVNEANAEEASAVNWKSNQLPIRIWSAWLWQRVLW